MGVFGTAGVRVEETRATFFPHLKILDQILKINVIVSKASLAFFLPPFPHSLSSSHIASAYSNKKKTPQRQRQQGGYSWETGSGEFHDPTSNPGTFLLPAPLSSPHLFPPSHASVSAFISSADDQKSELALAHQSRGEAARTHNSAQYPSTLQELEGIPTGANLLVGENSYEDLQKRTRRKKWKRSCRGETDS